jgi:two-component system, LytTR family, sensor kinase
MKRIQNHVLFWIGYIAFKLLLNLSSIDISAQSDQFVWSDSVLLMLYAQLAFLMVKVPLVYTLFYFLDRYYAEKIALVWALIWCVLSFFLAVPMLNWVNHKIVLGYVLESPSPMTLNWGSLFYYAFNLSAVVGIACSVKLARKQFSSKIKEHVLLNEKREAELKFLKSQMSPHFLFNTLNNIYSLARKKSDDTADAVMKLSKLMRFMIYESGHPTIPIIDELKLIKDYVSLEKLRYSDRLNFSYEESIDDPQQAIAPLILIHLVENAFKHGVSESRFDSTIDIDLKLVQGLLSFRISNSKENHSDAGSEKHIGVENIKRQLELLYPKHQLMVTNNQETYTVHLIILLNSYP